MTEQEKAAVIEEKTPIESTDTAPVADKPVEEQEPVAETLDAEEATDTIDEALIILNAIDQEAGGKGEIAEIPEGLSGPIGKLIENLILVRELFEDPLWKAILDDMADQKEDGQTPSVEVAIARNIPMEGIQGLAESEDYAGVQNELSSNLAATKQSAQEEADYEATFEESRKAGEEYAAKMGYDEEQTNALFEAVIELFGILADGKITVAEFEKVDKMLNYDGDMAELKAQIQSGDAKEVLPDKASVEAAAQAKTQAKTPVPTNSPGLASVYANPTSDYTQTGKRKRTV